MKVVGATPASGRVYPPRVLGSAGRSAPSMRRPHLRRYLDEFVFRWNAAATLPCSVSARACNPPLRQKVDAIAAALPPASVRAPIPAFYRPHSTRRHVTKLQSPRPSPGSVRRPRTETGQADQHISKGEVYFMTVRIGAQAMTRLSALPPRMLGCHSRDRIESLVRNVARSSHLRFACSPRQQFGKDGVVNVLDG